MIDYRKHAEELIKAEKQKQAITCISDQYSDFNLSMAYKIQEELVKIKIESGHKIAAYKMGLTSIAKMSQMNINSPIYGYVFDYMNIENKGEIIRSDYIHPKVEAEIAFVLEEDVEGPNLTGEQVLEKTQWVFPALEILDSRYEDFRFTLPDVIADNTSASRVVWGNQLFRPHEFALDTMGVTIMINGEVKAIGQSSAVLGNPANSVASLANMLYKDGKRKIPKGTIVLTGGITEAIKIESGDHIITKYDNMGDISFSVL